MPTNDQRDYVRYDLDTDSTAMPDSEINTLYTRAESRYGAGTVATEAYVRLLAVRRLKASAAKRVDYKQNQSQEWLSQMFKQLDLLEDQFQEDLELAINGVVSAVRFGGLKRFIPRRIELPDTTELPTDGTTDISRLENG